MTYKKLYEDALFKLEHNKITLGEFEEMIKPLEREIEQEPILDKIRAEIGKAWCIKPKNRYEEGLKDQALKDMQIIDRYKAENEVEDENVD